jgi:5-hydroxyisourate hydrolase
MNALPSITTHVLDTAEGKPAAGIAIVLEREEASGFVVLGKGVTDADGRLRTLMTGHALAVGVYRITFDTRTYYADCFYPYVSIAFIVKNEAVHYHVPLLLSPFGISTYRGS